MRVVSTLLLLASLWAMNRITVPGAISSPGRTAFESGAAIGAVAVSAWSTAAALVELGALTRDRWRALRVGGPEGRAALARTTRWVWALVVLAHGLVVAQALQDYGALVDPGWGGVRLVMLGLAAASAVLRLAVDDVSRAGLGNGWAIVVLSGWVVAGAGYVRARAEAVAQGYPPLLDALLLPAVVVALSLWSLKASAGEGSSRLPAGVTMPVLFGLTLPQTLVAFVPSLDLRGAWWVFVAGSAVIFAVLHHLPWNVAAVTGRSEADAWAGLVRALPANVAVGLVVGYEPELLFIPLTLAMARDVYVEWQARTALGELVVAWPLHRVYAVPVAEAALRDAGVEHVIRGVGYRTMTRFAGLLVPIEVLVRPSDVERAQAALAASTVSALPPKPGEASPVAES